MGLSPTQRGFRGKIPPKPTKFPQRHCCSGSLVGFGGNFVLGGNVGFWVAWLSAPFILFVWSSSWLWGRLLVYVVVLPFVSSSSRVCGRVLGSVVVVLSLSSFGFGGNVVLGVFGFWVAWLSVPFVLFMWPSPCL